jgi:hypothetical protein
MTALRWTLIVSACLIMGAPAVAAPANMLLGKWKVEGPHQVNSDGVDYCSANPEMIFTPTQQIMFGPASPGEKPPMGTDDVTYLVTGNTVYVSSSPGFLDAPKYTILNPNEMEADRIGNCHYRRQ